ncbi:MAG TPA: MFS transporter, partial [Candidatus Dormibacteraeota bacterium]
VASLPGRYVLNRVSERVGPQGLLAACYLAQSAGVALLAWAAAPALIWAYVAVYGAAFGAISPLRASTMADQFGRRAYGAITAVSGVPNAVAASIGPIAAGAIYDRLGGYGPALALTSGVFVISALAVVVTPAAGGRGKTSTL